MSATDDDELEAQDEEELRRYEEKFGVRLDGVRFEALQSRHYRSKLADRRASTRYGGLQDVLSNRLFELVPLVKQLLEDDAPVVGRRGSRPIVFEVRAHALRVLEDLYRIEKQPVDLGALHVRRAMAFSDVMSRAHLLIQTFGTSAREAAFARAASRLEERVRPSEDDWELVRNYCLLQDAGLVDGELQEVDPITYLTPLQEEIYASQVASMRPTPNLRIASKSRSPRTLGWIYREPQTRAWVRDFSEHPLSAKADEAVSWWHGAGSGGVPRLVFNWRGKPKRHLDRSFVLDGTISPQDENSVAYLRSIAAFLDDNFEVESNLEPAVIASVSPYDRARQSLEGLSIGDAFGEQFFRAPGGVLQLQHRTSPPPWPWTDDTQMALSIIDVLSRRGSIDQDELAEQFALRYEPHRGYGEAAHRLLQAVRAGEPWRTCSHGLFNGQGSHGNGAAMRVAPLGAFFADDLDRAAREAALSAEVTHAHPEGIAGAVAVAVGAALAWRSRGEPFDPVAFLTEVAQRTPQGATRDGIERAATLAAGSSTVEAGQILGNGSRISAADTVPFALWAVARHIDRFADALWATACALGDIDTTCAIVGSIIVLRTGVDAIPAEWLAAREPLPSTGQ